jgi:DNA polymerase III epsilon subunit family exonuclease
MEITENLKSIDDVVFTVFDTETTGDNVKREDKPIEVAAVSWNVKDGFLGKPKSWLIDPGISIHPAAIAVHGLMDEDLIGKPKLEDVLPELHEYIGNNILVAHNIAFDLNMLPTLKDLPNKRIDTLRFAKHIFTIGQSGYKNHPLSSFKMQELRYWLNVKIDTMGLSAHRAAADILVTGAVLGEMIKEFKIKNNDAKSIDEMLSFINAPFLIEKMPFGKYSGVLIEDAIIKEINNPKNYFSWLLKSVNSGEFKMDDDLLYSIKFYLKKLNISYEGLLVDKNIKSFKNFSNKQE